MSFYFDFGTIELKLSETISAFVSIPGKVPNCIEIIFQSAAVAMHVGVVTTQIGAITHKLPIRLLFIEFCKFHFSASLLRAQVQLHTARSCRTAVDMTRTANSIKCSGGKFFCAKPRQRKIRESFPFFSEICDVKVFEASLFHSNVSFISLQGAQRHLCSYFSFAICVHLR